MPEDVKKIGIDETGDVVEAVGSLLSGLAEAQADKTWTVTDAAYFIPFLKKIPEAVSGSTEIPKELLDLDNDEVVLLKDMVLASVTFGNNTLTQEAAQDVVIASLYILKAVGSIKKCTGEDSGE